MLRDFVNLLFPNYCLSCQEVLIKSEQWLCTNCFFELPQTNYHLALDNPVAQKFYGRVPITYAMALYKFRSGNRVQQLIHHLKYGNKPAIGELLGEIYASYLLQKTWDSNFDCIVPVPLHPHRVRERGYNQSDYFAKGIAALLEIPWYNNCLQRIKHTSTQTQKGKEERLYNLRDAFYVVNTSLIQGKHVLLVDDIITTGATLEACALPLLAAGAKEVSIAAIGVVE
ncbi:hypothetical protein Aasi_1314 [Candidatus Amoebophilus asiaticus 5a2]|uniref:Phosphoribosyltransferase domain-containing protein n=1 Tax=Amoebophilus asiaticus (strain 5a2) TaxID=452471 RepID=B3ETS2_AMOA5|nr:ComF family protein [Candidatus Amoebophilus asiaticus]ACE06624.1 hypothetical protein Aasi_1314 [Candidatus Amoebophilus asiaticus 5a2]